MRQFDEFPSGSAEWPNELSRRRFLKLMGASIALAGASGCTRNPPEQIVPYVKEAEEIIPGKPLYYASALTLGGYARGVLVETHEGRPTKIEGNPDHPASLGASDVFMQAELLTLFDPHRSKAIINAQQVSTWEALAGELSSDVLRWRGNGGSGLRLLTRHQTSPTFIAQIDRLLRQYPAAKWHEWEPLASTGPAAVYHFDKAEVIVSLGADFLASGPMSLRYTRDFAAARRPNGKMNRLYVAESTPSLTGAMADHQILMRPGELEQFARDLQSGVGSTAAQLIAQDLRAHMSKSVVIAGEFEPAAIQNCVRTLNDSLQNTGATVDYIASSKHGAHEFGELVDEMRSGAVETLMIIGSNPAFDAPADREFSTLLPKIAHSVHIGLYRDETAELCQWHIPETHELESWDDACAGDATATIMQPVIEPLFGGHSRHELLTLLLAETPATSYDVVRAFWQTQYGGPDFEKFWRKSVHDGVVAGWKAPSGQPVVATSSQAAPSHEPAGKSGLNLLIRPSARMYDGRFANNAWLQELPDPLTTIVWDNAALISAATAHRLELDTGDVVNLKFRSRCVRMPVWILPAQTDDCVTVHVGYGRTRAGPVGNGIGFNAYALRTFDAPWGGPGLEVEKTGERHEFVTTQHHWTMEGRDPVRVGTFEEFQHRPTDIVKAERPPPRDDQSLYPKVAYSGHAWGMVIDLNACIGCGACTIACQAENNIPVVGKEQVARGREMHWIRVDRYFENGLTTPRILHQPIPCMHCENAPCELVCPVAATVHSSEGLNQMVYNRCIGTRYCSNNCPYKVRRFNFLQYDANQFEQPASRKLMRNPNVTVRSRGVMEKCTYCIQRINAVKIEAEKANRAIRDGEITPACAQACPADAIIFGDINDPKSRAAKLRSSPLNYGLLAELNTAPRTTYLARLRNPNPKLEAT